MNKLVTCIRQHPMDPDDAAELRAYVNASNGDAAKGVRKYMFDLKEDLRKVREELKASGFDVQPRQEFAQSVSVTETEAFKKWFGDSKVVDANGKPLVVYHGTTADFEAFDPEKANPESDMGAGFYFSNTSGDVASNYAGFGPDLTGKIEREAERIASETDREYDDPAVVAEARAKFASHEGMTVPAYLSMQNPVVVGGSEETFFDYSSNYDEETEEYGDPTGKLVDFVEALKSVLENDQFYDVDVDAASSAIFERGADYEGLSSSDLVDLLKSEDGGINYATNENGDLVVNEIIRKAFHEAGFDGIIDNSVNSKFGSERSSGKSMEGMDEGTVHYIAFSPEQIKSVNNRGTFDPADPRILYQQQRGSISLPMSGPADGQTIINLFEKANLSTFLHESGHYFLAVLKQAAAGDTGDIAQMHKSVMDWFVQNAGDVALDAKSATGISVNGDDVRLYAETGSTGDAVKDNAIETGMQEQFARGFEAYVMEGKAPSHELRGAFERFRAWLINIYRSVVGLNVNMTDDIRRVFDRMLATDDEIKKAEADVFADMLFDSPESAGLSPEDYVALKNLHQNAKDKAAQRLIKKTMAPLARQREAWYKEERKAVADEVETRINTAPVYRAWEWLANGRWLGADQPEEMPVDLRMSKSDLVDAYGEGVLKTLPRGKQAVYKDGGLAPDEVAGWFGFPSGDALVKALEQAPKRSEAIEAETERVMQERHGDVLKDGSVEEAAVAAVQNDERLQYLAAELKVVQKLTGSATPGITWQQAKEVARVTLAAMPVRDAIKSNRYLAAERRAADDLAAAMRTHGRTRLQAQAKLREVPATAKDAIAAGSENAIAQTNRAIEGANKSVGIANKETGDAAKLARSRLLNAALYAESRKIADEVEAAERYVGRLSKAVRKARSEPGKSSLAGDYVEALEELLDRYDFRAKSGRAEDRKGALLAYVERMREEGREAELAIPDAVLADAKRTPYRLLKVTALRGVIDTMKNVEHTARMKRKLVDAQKQRDLDETVASIVDAITANVKKADISRARSGRSSLSDGVSKYMNLIKTADTILREADGFTDAGAVYQNLKADIDKAQSDLIIKRKEAAEKFDDLYSVYSVQERRLMSRLMDVKELGGQFSKWDLISIALNTGNEDNFQRLTDKRVKGSFTPDQVKMALKRLDERDWKFVQSAWDMINGYWPEIEARERRVTGVAPEKVQPREVDTPFGKFRGGYFPLKYDADLSGAARNDELTDISNAMQAGRFGKAQTRNGHLKERANSSGRPVLIDLSVMHGHINQVVHDLALSEVVNNSWKILKDRRVENAFIEHGMRNELDTLQAWLMDVAAGQQRSADFMSVAARRIKTGFTFSRLAFNLKTVMLQPVGIAQSMVVVGKKNFALGFADMFRVPGPSIIPINNAAEAVMAKSAFMRERQTTFNKDVYDVLDNVRTGPGNNAASDFVSNWMAPAGFWLMTKAQFYGADLPTWFAGYRKAKAAGMDEDAAVAEADRAVARAQASGIFSDRSAIERGTLSQTFRQNDVVRLFTALGSYMFAKFNVAYEKTRQTDFSNPMQIMSWTMDMALLFTLEAIGMAIINGKLPDEEDEEDDWPTFLARETAFSMLGTLPLIRDAASVSQGFNGGGAYGSFMSIIGKPANRIMDGKFDHTLARQAIDAGGVFFMFPSVQFNRFYDAMYRESQGEDVPPLEYLVGKR